MSDRIPLSSDVSSIKGIGGKKKQTLASAGIRTIDDLLADHPVKYKDRRNLVPAARTHEDRDYLVCGELTRVNIRPISGGRTLVECTLRDDSAVFSAVFFNMPYLRKTLSTGTRYILFGKMKMRNGMRVWTNPEMTPAGSERDVRGIVPVYRNMPGITGANLTKWIRMALDTADIDDDWLGAGIIADRRLCGRGFALRNIHFPESEQHYKTARYRLIYERLLTYQLAIRMSRQKLESGTDDASIKDLPVEGFISSLPFTLTDGQLQCIREIEADLISTRPMNRLVQGDVGCGKTVVAEAAMYKCALGGHQSAMMAPTEILARQHYDRLSKDLEPFGFKVCLLISGMKAAERRAVLSDIA